MGLALWAISGWWLVLAIGCVVQTFRQGIPFTVGWWGSVFPIGTFAGECCQPEMKMHSYMLLHTDGVVCWQQRKWVRILDIPLLGKFHFLANRPPCNRLCTQRITHTHMQCIIPGLQAP